MEKLSLTKVFFTNVEYWSAVVRCPKILKPKSVIKLTTDLFKSKLFIINGFVFRAF